MSAGFPPNSPFAPQFQQPPRRSGTNWLLGLLLAGFGVLLLGGALVIGGVWYVASNIDRWLVHFGREAIVSLIEDSEIPAQEKKEVIEQVDRVVNLYKERKINQQDLSRVLEELQNSPALTVISLYGIDDSYLSDTKLSEQELAQGHRAFQRVIRGIYEGKIDEDDLYGALPDFREDVAQASNKGPQVRPASTTDPDKIADDDLREAITRLKVMADNAQIPDEPFQIDIGDEFKKAVDKALAGKK